MRPPPQMDMHGGMAMDPMGMPMMMMGGPMGGPMGGFGPMGMHPPMDMMGGFGGFGGFEGDYGGMQVVLLITPVLARCHESHRHCHAMRGRASGIRQNPLV